MGKEIRRDIEMITIKEEAAQLVEQLPEHATWDDLMYRIYVHQKLATARRFATAEERQEDPVPAGAPEGETFAQRWRGKFEPADRDDELYKALAKKYL